MKIKEVCKRTGLTDKAIRTYISEGLISPSFSENYEGRKSYSFSENDITNLKKIIIYRRAGLSLSVIKSVLDNSVSLREALEASADRLDDNSEEIALSRQLVDDLIEGGYTNESIDIEFFLGDKYQPDSLKDLKRKNAKIVRYVTVMLFLLCAAVIGNTVLKILNGELQETADIIIQIIFDIVSVGAVSIFLYYFKSLTKLD